MKIIFITLIFHSISLHGMINSPEDIIRANIQKPSDAIELLNKFSHQTLLDYRDKKYNNLMHITIRELISNKRTQDYVHLKDESKKLLHHLAKIGISVNEVNDDHETACMLAYKDNDTQDLAEYFLVPQLQAHITYFSLNPEIRRLKRTFSEFFCGCCRRKLKNS